ncbi:MAG: hypothetical protein IPQ19_16645 [Bacteroidetes bacterium]|nr:hypothetical protein [Bacteroidota bacterium]
MARKNGRRQLFGCIEFEHIKMPLKAKEGRNIAWMRYARKGIITAEMEYIAIRENQKIDEYNKKV